MSQMRSEECSQGLTLVGNGNHATTERACLFSTQTSLAVGPILAARRRTGNVPFRNPLVPTKLKPLTLPVLDASLSAETVCPNAEALPGPCRLEVLLTLLLG